jgi:hypothetical protein
MNALHSQKRHAAGRRLYRGIFTGAITDGAGNGMSKNEIGGRTIAYEPGCGTFKLKHARYSTLLSN